MHLLIINKISDRAETGLYIGLKQAGLRLTLILDPADPVASQMRDLGFSVYQLGIKHRFDFKFDRELKKIIDSNNFNCIYAPTSRGVTSTVRVAKHSSIGLVAYRGTLGHLNWFNPIDRMGHLNSRVSSIVCNCEAVKNFLLKQHVANDKLPVIYKGHDPHWYQSKIDLDLKQFGIDQDTFVVGCFANIRPLKGIDVLLQAIQQIKNKLKIKLLVIGKIEGQELVEQCKALGIESAVSFLGYRKDISELLKICDISVVPSVRREGFPRVIVESFSNKIPVICTNVGGMPEIVRHQYNGLIVEPGNFLKLAEAIEYMYFHPEFRQNAGEHAYNTVITKLNQDKYVAAMLNVFYAASRSASS